MFTSCCNRRQQQPLKLAQLAATCCCFGSLKPIVPIWPLKCSYCACQRLQRLYKVLLASKTGRNIVILVSPEYEQPRFSFSRVGLDDKRVLLYLRLHTSFNLLLLRFSRRLRCIFCTSFTEIIV